MKKNPIRHFFTNIICAFIPGKMRRRKIRVLLNSDLFSFLLFIRNDLKTPIRKIYTDIGARAKHLIIIVNDAWVYKFPLRKKNSNEIALREKRIVDAFKSISPIKIPDIELLKYKDVYVRKYPYVKGKTLSEISKKDAYKNMDKWTQLLAEFMSVISHSDPESIRDLKTTNTDAGSFCGWYHGDLCGNFMVDMNTKKIIAVIDWEDCLFCDFNNMFFPKDLLRSEFMHVIYDKFLRLEHRKK